MYHTIALSPARQNHINISHTNVLRRFYLWTVGQEEKKFMWLAFSFVLQVGLALPCTLFSVVNFGGNNFNLWLAVCVVNVPPFALTLAAQPTKVIIPVLFLAWLVDAGIIIYTLTSFFIHK